MNWINLRTETLRSGDFANARPGAIETWLRVLAYCCEQENGGQLSRACEWTDRGWMTTCGVTKAEIQNAYPLVYDDAVDVFVAAFPTEKQAEVQAKRKGGKRGGRRSASSRASSTPSKSASTEGEGEGEGERKENRKEKKNVPKEPTTQAALPPNGKGIVEGRDSSNLPTTEQSRRIAKLFHRRLDTRWSDEEVRAYKKIGTIPEENLAALEAYYAANWPPRTNINILRHDLQTLLNNFVGEIDRAKVFQTNPKAHEQQRTNSNPRPDSNRNVGHNANLDYSKRSAEAQARADRELDPSLRSLFPRIRDAGQSKPPTGA